MIAEDYQKAFKIQKPVAVNVVNQVFTYAPLNQTVNDRGVQKKLHDEFNFYYTANTEGLFPCQGQGLKQLECIVGFVDYYRRVGCSVKPDVVLFTGDLNLVDGAGGLTINEAKAVFLGNLLSEPDYVDADMIAHELFGHFIGRLNDEYLDGYNGDPNYKGEPSMGRTPPMHGPNCIKNIADAPPEWTKHLLEGNSLSGLKVDFYQGCYYSDWWRPTKASIMNSDVQQSSLPETDPDGFGAVNQEFLKEKLSELLGVTFEDQCQISGSPIAPKKAKGSTKSAAAATPAALSLMVPGTDNDDDVSTWYPIGKAGEAGMLNRYDFADDENGNIRLRMHVTNYPPATTAQCRNLVGKLRLYITAQNGTQPDPVDIDGKTTADSSGDAFTTVFPKSRFTDSGNAEAVYKYLLGNSNARSGFGKIASIKIYPWIQTGGSADKNIANNQEPKNVAPQTVYSYTASLACGALTTTKGGYTIPELPNAEYTTAFGGPDDPGGHPGEGVALFDGPQWPEGGNEAPEVFHGKREEFVNLDTDHAYFNAMRYYPRDGRNHSSEQEFWRKQMVLVRNSGKGVVVRPVDWGPSATYIHSETGTPADIDLSVAAIQALGAPNANINSSIHKSEAGFRDDARPYYGPCTP